MAAGSRFVFEATGFGWLTVFVACPFVAAGLFVTGIIARAKNWFCTEAQATLLFPARYSVFGTRGNTSNVEVLVLKYGKFTGIVFVPSFQSTDSAWPLSCGPIGVAVPITHSCAGIVSAWLDRFSRRTDAVTR